MNIDEMLKTLGPPKEWTVDSADALPESSRGCHSLALPESPWRGRIWYRPTHWPQQPQALTAMLLLPAAFRSGAHDGFGELLHFERVSVVELPYKAAA